MRLHRIALAVLMTLAFTLPAAAQRRGQITPGSAAPGLDIEEWDEGDAATIEPDYVYVVVFFHSEDAADNNTQTFVYLNDLIAQYDEPHLRVIAVTSLSLDRMIGITDKHTKHERIYLGNDRRNSSVRAWVNASGKDDVPLAFIVDRKSTIQYIGALESEQFRSVLSQVMDNRYDAVLMQQAQAFIGPAANARKVRNYRQCFMHLDRIIELDKRIFAQYRLMKFEIMLLDQGEKKAAYDYAREQVQESLNDANFLRWLVEFVVVDPRVPAEDRDLDFALEVAEKSAAAMSSEMPQRYALPALVHYHRGELAKAVEQQEKAWMVARPNNKDWYWRTLLAYKDAARRQGVLSSLR